MLVEESMRYTISSLVLATALAFAQPSVAQPHLQGALPAFFIPNVGQTHPSVRFLVDTPELRAGFTAGSAIFQLDGLNLRVRFAGANSHPAMEGVERLSARANFLLGDRPQDWKTNLPVYQRILYRDLYPGIDMSYGGSGPNIKSEFLVAPGADPNQIRLDYSGAALAISPNGDLLIRDGNAEAREAAPVIYQEAAEHRHVEIPGRYRLLDAHTVGFEIDAYDRSRPLIIDPVLSYATYLGGSGLSAVTGAAVDSSGNLYVTGWTASLDFHIVTPVQASNAGGVDAFVAKLNPAGSGLVYATYIGGRGDDRGQAIAVDGAGQAYVTGSTASANFPLLAPISSALSGGRDAFVLKLSAAGNILLYSTYLGGGSADYGNAIAVDSSGNAYIAGDTLSSNFPVVGAAQPVFGGSQDAFVTELSSTGAILFSTFLGGALVEHAGGIALDSSRNVYIAGGTTSTNFPVVGAIQASNGGNQDAFLTKFNSTGSAIVYSTYLGRSGGGIGTPEQANAVAVDSSGSAYIAGTTNSVNFPVTTGALQVSYDAVQTAFAAKVNPAVNALVYSTYLGGSVFDWANGLAVAANGSAYVAGFTSSPDFPTAVPLQASFNGLYDAFVSVLNATGSALNFSTFWGGTGADEANAIALDAAGNMYVAGQTSSIDLTLLNPIQSSNVGGSIGWLAAMGAATLPPPLPATDGVSPASGSGSSAIFTAQYSDPAGVAALASVTVLVNTTGSPDHGCQVTYLAASNQFALANDIASTGSTFVNPSGGSAQNSQCTLNGSGSSVTVAGNVLTAVVSMTFQPGFAGSDTVWLSAVDTSANTTGLVSAGTWTVTGAGPIPTVTSVTPSSAMGSIQTFTFTFSDTQNPLNITTMSLLFNTSVSFPSACYISVDRIQGTIGLALDSGSGFTSEPLSSNSLLQNSQCTVGAAALVTSGLSANLTVAMTFNGGFGGVKNIYMFASDNGVTTTGWVQMGTYTVAAPLQFYLVPPCRIADTRASQPFTGAFGPPSLPAYASRNFPLPSSGCSIPSTALAYSLNFTAIPSGPLSFLSVWPAGDPYPGVSTLNSNDGSVIANAAIVSAGTSGGITVVAGNPTDLTIDINGYFALPGDAGLDFFPLTPCRIADTRTSQPFTGKFGPPALSAYVTRDFPISTSACLTGSEQAYSLNVTVVPSGPLEFLSAWPVGQAYPVVSTLNSPNGAVLANAAIVRAGTKGDINVVVGNPTDVIIDINGKFAAPATGGLRFYAVTPCRVADTRASQGFTGAFGPPPLAAYMSRNFPIPSSHCGIPAAAQTYALNITVVPPGPLSFLSVWPAGQPYPSVSTLNSLAGDVIANAAIVPAVTGGAITVVVGNPTDLIIDILGYFAP